MANVNIDRLTANALKRFIKELNTMYECYGEAMNGCSDRDMRDRDYYYARIQGMEKAFELLTERFVLIDDPEWNYKRHIAYAMPELETEEEP